MGKNIILGLFYNLFRSSEAASALHFKLKNKILQSDVQSTV